MTIGDIRQLADITKRHAEEAFRKQMDQSDRRIEAYVRATRILHAGLPQVRVACSAEIAGHLT